MKLWQSLLYGILIGLLATGVILLVSQPERGTPITLSPPPTPTQTQKPFPTSTPAPVLVQIGGEITKPGIYPLPLGSRLRDLIELSGGLTSKADVNRVNLVAPLQDGDYFYIPAVGEEIPETAKNSPLNANKNVESGYQYPLNINKATQDELESLPGIGPAKAADILEYRETNGAFSTLEELLNIPGIGPATLETLQEYLYIEP